MQEEFEDPEYDWSQTAYGQSRAAGLKTGEDVIEKRVKILRAYLDKGAKGRDNPGGEQKGGQGGWPSKHPDDELS